MEMSNPYLEDYWIWNACLLPVIIALNNVVKRKKVKIESNEYINESVASITKCNATRQKWRGKSTQNKQIKWEENEWRVVGAYFSCEPSIKSHDTNVDKSDRKMNLDGSNRRNNNIAIAKYLHGFYAGLVF